ncbi:BTB domain-containing protein [Oryctes borbonicus]|uniref:BTB domain-containing protein n=1 Tax=Oryctes borbonicus TaxID=1629725 RepID=A0A0T6B6S9_9SCAR|nr:BTB domain-containing protein [Oryctes borbonicus]
MEGEQFSLCWNNFHNNLSSGFHTLLQNEDLVDVTLAAEGKYLKAHKTVLSICSPYFKELFRVNPCKHPIVILQDVSYNSLHNLLQFMYQGEVSVSQEEIPTFMRVAEMLKVKGLTDNSGSADTNGLDSHRNTYTSSSDNKQFLKRRPIKKIIKPIQHLKPIEPPRNIKSPPSARSIPQPPAKQPRYEDPSTPASDYLSPVTVNTKQEPVDSADEFREQTYDDHNMDMSSMLDTTLGEPSDLKTSTPMLHKLPTDTSSPGTLQCIVGKRGNPRLIVDGHTFFKKSTYKTKCFWYCKFNRNQYKCQATCWTRNGQIVKWPTGHTHAVIPEVINPDEDTVVPIERFREVLIQAALRSSY